MNARKFNKVDGKIEQILADLPKGNTVQVDGLKKDEASELTNHYTNLIYSTKVHPALDASTDKVNESYSVHIWRTA